jgi:hypothetical protein
MIYAALIIGAIVLATLFLGLPYYQAYQRRKELARQAQLEREQDKGSDQTTAGSGPSQK